MVAQASWDSNYFLSHTLPIYIFKFEIDFLPKTVKSLLHHRSLSWQRVCSSFLWLFFKN